MSNNIVLTFKNLQLSSSENAVQRQPIPSWRTKSRSLELVVQSQAQGVGGEA